MARTPDEAIASCARQEVSGPPFGVGLCKRKCREAYEVPSDGSGSASEAWTRTKHRVNVAPDQAKRGALLWWTGGGSGYGHVAIADGKGGVWSTDILKDGYWGHVPFARIGSSWPNLNFVGVSYDIDGVQVVFPDAPEAEKPAVTAAEKDRARVTKFAKRLYEDRVIDLNLLDGQIRDGSPAYWSAAAKACRSVCVNAAKAFLRVVN